MLQLKNQHLQMRKIDIVGVKVDVIDKTGLHQAIADCVRNDWKEVFAYVTIHAINIAQRDEVFRHFLNNSATVYCDGEGVRLGARILAPSLPPRIVLTRWIWELCSFCTDNRFSVFFLGGSKEASAEAVRRLLQRYPEIAIAGYHHGYFDKTGAENGRVVDLINSVKPNLLFVGFGMPEQERWIQQNLSRLDVNAVLPCGSMVDYVAGMKSVAPAWMADFGMEWMYRLFQEPGRLWKRYLLGNPEFIFRVLLQRIREEKRR